MATFGEAIERLSRWRRYHRWRREHDREAGRRAREFLWARFEEQDK